MAISVNDFLDTQKPQRDILLLGVEALKDPESLKEIVGKNACVDALLVSMTKYDSTFERNLNSVYPERDLQSSMSHVIHCDKLLQQRKERFGA